MRYELEPFASLQIPVGRRFTGKLSLQCAEINNQVESLLRGNAYFIAIDDDLDFQLALQGGAGLSSSTVSGAEFYFGRPG